MVSRHRFTAAALLLMVPLALAGCDTKLRATISASTLTGPSFGVFGAHIAPDTLRIVTVPTFSCPVAPPFATNFNLIVDGSGTDVFLNDVGLQFVDRSGFIGAPLAFHAADLGARFGSTIVRAGTSRSFSFRPQFGCDVFHPQFVVARVVIVDSFGAAQQFSMRVPFG